MRIVDCFELSGEEQARAREAIRHAGWRGAQHLYALLMENRLREQCGASTRLLLGMEGDALAAFCTLAERDDVDAPLMPWIGYVYTFPAFRGQRRCGELIERACDLARREGFERVYLSTREVGLYEKYGFAFMRSMKDSRGDDTRVYCRNVSGKPSP